MPVTGVRRVLFRSEELVNSYFEAENVSEEDIDSSAFSALEDYLSGMDAI
jgi:hypothetical protein